MLYIFTKNKKIIYMKKNKKTENVDDACAKLENEL